MNSLGLRNSKARDLILKIISRSSGPISAREILEIFNQKKVKVNKTTVYRDLVFWQERSEIVELVLNDGVSRYEPNRHHHHHVVCKNCQKIEEIESVEVEPMINLIEEKIRKEGKFGSVAHSLEFFGLCNHCQKTPC